MSMLRTCVMVLLVLFLAGPATAQQTPDTTQPPCTAPEASQFDFWVGEWDLTWADSGRGTNTITKPYGNCVIQEQFRDLEANSLHGMSVSTYDARAGKWKQTWVDNMGSYLDFTGEFKDGKMILSRNAVRPDGTPVIQRMVWHDISRDGLIWDWQASTDGGKTWITNWQITYTRRK